MVVMADFALITHHVYHHAIVQLLSWRRACVEYLIGLLAASVIHWVRSSSAKSKG